MKRIVVLALVATACSRRPVPAAAHVDASGASGVSNASDAAASATSSAAPSGAIPPDGAPPPRAPLGGAEPFVTLEAPADAGPRAASLGVVSVPLGAREPRPIMIALHGGSDHPEWACQAWRGITGGFPFLVCPRGVGNEAALAWSSPVDTKQRVARAVAATKARFGTWVRDTETVVLVGFSMGATQAVYLAQGEPHVYRRLSLAESAYAPAPVMQLAKPWSAGGERVIFLCTTPGCEAPYRRAARNVAQHGVAARLDLAGTTQHGMWPEVVQSMRRDWPWLVEGAEGWEAYRPEPDAGLPGETESFAP